MNGEIREVLNAEKEKNVEMNLKNTETVLFIASVLAIIVSVIGTATSRTFNEAICLILVISGCLFAALGLFGMFLTQSLKNPEDGKRSLKAYNCYYIMLVVAFAMFAVVFLLILTQ